MRGNSRGDSSVGKKLYVKGWRRGLAKNPLSGPMLNSLRESAEREEAAGGGPGGTAMRFSVDDEDLSLSVELDVEPEALVKRTTDPASELGGDWEKTIVIAIRS
jgi:hypothetical protein